jgi:hypothetical protein
MVQRIASRGGAIAARQAEYNVPVSTITNDSTKPSSTGTGVSRNGTRKPGAVSIPGKNSQATP